MRKIFGCLCLLASLNFALVVPAVAGTTSTITPVAEVSVPTAAANTTASEAASTQSLPAPISAKAPPVKTGSAAQLANLLGGLALIVVLILGLSWFVKRFSRGGFMHNPTMKILSSMPLGTRERLMLIEVGSKQLLLGVTATQISTLHVFDEPVVAQQTTEPQGSEFSQKLMAILQQKNFVQPKDSFRKN